ncbi:MAG TPA: hypothetical protein VGL38_12325, partial [bacterium]
MRPILLILLLATLALAGTPLPQTAFFVQNEGQWDGAFSFKYDAPGATYFLTSSGLTLDLHQFEGSALSCHLVRVRGLHRSLRPADRYPFTCHPAARLRDAGSLG